MTATLKPVPVDDRVFDILRRMGRPDGIEAFIDQAKGARFCSRPIRLKGRIEQVDSDGHRTVTFDTRHNPDGALLKACGTRRETLCKSCSSIYRGDAFALVAAGIRGGKGVSESVALNPAVLLTLTAPSFGQVHRNVGDGSCHRSGRLCRHGRLMSCRRRHRENEHVLGEALCGDCYDYEAAVLFNSRVTELWRRTMIYALRSLGNLVGLSVRTVTKQVRLSYVKVVEFQRRGSVHLHAVVRLDARGEEGGPPGECFSGELLGAALRLVAGRVSVPVAKAEGPESRLGWGKEVDVAILTDADHGRRRAASYLAKYSTKSTESQGILDHRLRAGVPDALQLPTHLRRLVETAWRLGEEPGYENLRLRAWAHSAGYRGHFLTKSRVFSTTFGALREMRQSWRVAQKSSVVSSDAESETLECETEIVGRWRFVGIGYVTAGDSWLAESLGEEERVSRRCAYQDSLELLEEAA